MADFATIAGIGSNIAGVCGLALSVLNYAGRQQDKRPNLKITLDVGAWSGTPNGIFLACLRAVNTGQRRVSVEEAGVMLPDNRKILFNFQLLGDNLPRELLQGQHCARYQSVVDLAASLATAGYGEGVKLRGYVRDAESRYYVAKARRFFAENFIAAQKTADASQDIFGLS